MATSSGTATSSTIHKSFHQDARFTELNPRRVRSRSLDEKTMEALRKHIAEEEAAKNPAQNATLPKALPLSQSAPTIQAQATRVVDFKTQELPPLVKLLPVANRAGTPKKHKVNTLTISSTGSAPPAPLKPNSTPQLKRKRSGSQILFGSTTPSNKLSTDIPVSLFKPLETFVHQKTNLYSPEELTEEFLSDKLASWKLKLEKNLEFVSFKDLKLKSFIEKALKLKENQVFLDLIGEAEGLQTLEFLSHSSNRQLLVETISKLQEVKRVLGLKPTFYGCYGHYKFNAPFEDLKSTLKPFWRPTPTKQKCFKLNGALLELPILHAKEENERYIEFLSWFLKELGLSPGTAGSQAVLLERSPKIDDINSQIYMIPSIFILNSMTANTFRVATKNLEASFPAFFKTSTPRGSHLTISHDPKRVTAFFLNIRKAEKTPSIPEAPETGGTFSTSQVKRYLIHNNINGNKTLVGQFYLSWTVEGKIKGDSNTAVGATLKLTRLQFEQGISLDLKYEVLKAFKVPELKK